MSENNNITNYELTNATSDSIVSGMEILYDHIVCNGVYALETGGESTYFAVEATGEMNIQVKAGQGVFANKGVILEENYNITVPPADSDNPRIDSVLVQVDLTNNCANLVYRTGTPAEKPTAPVITSSASVKEYRLANIDVGAGVASIESSSITDLRGTRECPWITNLVENGFADFVNVVQEGINNNGEATDLSSVLSQASDVIYYFPEGTYKVTEYTFQNCHNVTILAPNAIFECNTEEADSNRFFFFLNCTNCKVIGGIYDGKNMFQHGIGFYNTNYSTIKDIEVRNIGNIGIKNAAGICFMGDCSNSTIENVKIHNIQAGEKDEEAGNYIFASGIAINLLKATTSSSRKYSQNIVIENACIYDIGTAQYSDNDGGTRKIDGDGIFIIQRPEYVEDKTLEATTDEKAYLYFKYKLLGEGTYYLDRMPKAEIGNSRIAMEIKNVNGVDTYEYRVEVVDETESNIKIINPNISNCSKRAIKASARCVDIIGGNIDVASWGAAIEYQYTRNSTIRDLHISNKTMTCLTICGGDGIMTVENCYFSGSGEGNGIVLYRENNNNSNIKRGGENIIISNCDFENVSYPIYSRLAEGEVPVVSDSIVIRDCTIGHFYGEDAIHLSPNRFASLNKLKISDITFKYGNTISDIFAANNNFYDRTEENGLLVESTNVIYLGTVANHIDPASSLIIDIDNIQDDFDELFKLYGFSAKNVFFGGAPALASLVYEYPEYITMTAGDEYTSTSGNLTAKILSDYSIEVTGTRESSSKLVYIPIREFVACAGIGYVIQVTTDTVYTSSEVSISLFKDNVSGNRVGEEISLNSTSRKKELLLEEDTTAKYIGIKLRAVSETTNDTITDIAANITFSVTAPTHPNIKGVIALQDKLASLESKVAELEELHTANG